ncbi:MAG: prepilin-type N-terminal cleavage/methylation domain-containing protein [Deinococcales bacterium]
MQLNQKVHRFHKNQALSLIEILIALLMFAIVMAAFNQVFNGSMRSSRELNISSELTSEAQLAQQIVNSRLTEATYIYPTATTLSLDSNALTTNSIRPSAGQQWLVGTDPFLAAILPPAPGSSDLMFYAYYPMKRNHYLSAMASVSKVHPNPDPTNDDAVWVLLEYRKAYTTADGLFALPSAAQIRGGQSLLLLDYLQPQSNNSPIALDYTLFTINTAEQRIFFDIRLMQ